MIIRGKNTIVGRLDLSSLERLGEQLYLEKYPFHLSIKSGDVVTIDDEYCGLKSIQNALTLGYIEIEREISECDLMELKAFPGYDETNTKKQVFVNVNGVFGWRTAKDCNGNDA